MVLFESAFCKVWFDEESRVIFAKWNGLLTLEEVKEGCSLMSVFIEKHGVKLHFSNHVNLKVLSNDVQLYLTQEWFPEVEKLGLRKIVALVSWDFMGATSVEKVNKEARVGELKIQSFKSELEGHKWLME